MKPTVQIKIRLNEYGQCIKACPFCKLEDGICFLRLQEETNTKPGKHCPREGDYVLSHCAQVGRSVDDDHLFYQGQNCKPQ